MIILLSACMWWSYFWHISSTNIIEIYNPILLQNFKKYATKLLKKTKKRYRYFYSTEYSASLRVIETGAWAKCMKVKIVLDDWGEKQVATKRSVYLLHHASTDLFCSQKSLSKSYHAIIFFYRIERKLACVHYWTKLNMHYSW